MDNDVIRGCDDSLDATFEFNPDVLYILPPQDSKPIKVVYQDSHPCPLSSNWRCEKSQLSVDDMDIKIECTDFKNCPRFNP
jgi:hypothetical protein